MVRSNRNLFILFFTNSVLLTSVFVIASSGILGGGWTLCVCVSGGWEDGIREIFML